MIGIFFTENPVRNIDDVDEADPVMFTRMFHNLLNEGVHLPPSPYETMFFSLAHGDAEIDATIEAFQKALGKALSRRRVDFY
jgi:glutamate-1-semialdehyde 2,1-aminomutase